MSSPEAKFMKVQLRWSFWEYLESSQVSVYNAYITNQYQTAFAQGEEGSKFCYIEVTVNSKEKNS